MDFFKVVYINETNKVEPVPHNWEKGGVLYWPPTQRQEKQLQCCAKSVPNYKRWKTFSCVVKESNIHFLGEANDKAEYYSNLLFTEDKCVIQNIAQNNNNVVSRELNHTHFHQPASCSQQFSNISLPNHSSLITHMETDLQNMTPQYLEELVDNSPETSELKVLTAIVLNKLNEMLQTITTLSVRIDNLERNSIINKKTISDFKHSSVVLQHFPIKTVKDMDEFEVALKSRLFYDQVVSELKRLNGTGQKMVQCAYKLQNHMFAKDLLVKYTWTGNTTNAGTKKLMFRNLTYVLSLFYDVISYSDASCTHKDVEVFFKEKVLKHAKERLIGKKRSNHTKKVLIDGKKSKIVGKMSQESTAVDVFLEQSYKEDEVSSELSHRVTKNKVNNTYSHTLIKMEDEDTE